MVGVAVGPIPREPVIYANCIENIVAAGVQRTDQKTADFPFEPTQDDRKKIGEVLAHAMGYKGNRKYHVFSKEQLDAEHP